jgi:hypothetical protein
MDSNRLASEYKAEVMANIPLKKTDPSYKSVKSKAIPLQALTGPEGSRRLRLPDFKTICTQIW